MTDTPYDYDKDVDSAGAPDGENNAADSENAVPPANPAVVDAWASSMARGTSNANGSPAPTQQNYYEQYFLKYQTEARSSSTPSPTPPDTTALDKALDGHAYPLGMDQYNQLFNGKIGDPVSAEARAMARPTATAQYISDNWEKWNLPENMKAEDFKNPPASLPAEAQAALKYIGQNPALLEAMDGMNKKDGIITMKDAADFHNASFKDQVDASKSYNDWRAAHPNTTDAEKAQAQKDAILAANKTYIGKGGSKENFTVEKGSSAELVRAMSGEPPVKPSETPAPNPAPSPSPNPTTVGVDTAALDKALDSHGYPLGMAQYNQLFGKSSTDPLTTEARDLARPTATAQYISDNWEKWNLPANMKAEDFKNPPASLPPEAQAALKYVGQNPALLSAVDGVNNKDGIVTSNDFMKFHDESFKDQVAASAAFKTWEKNNPNAGPLAREVAQSAAIVAASKTLLDHSSPSDITTANGLPKSLVSANTTWQQPGMKRILDVAGDNSASAAPDGVVARQNIENFLTKGYAPGNDIAAMNMVNSAAMRSLTDGVDLSKVTPDFFNNLGSQDPKTKAAVYADLIDMRNHMTSAYAQGLVQVPQDTAETPDQAYNKALKDIDDRLAKLSADPGMQSYINDNKVKALQNIVTGSPGLLDAVHAFESKVNDGSALTEALAAKDANGKPVPMGAALQAYAQAASLANVSYGGNGKPDLTVGAKKSSQYGAVADYYKNKVGNATEMKADIAGGMDPVAAYQKAVATASSAKAVLGDGIAQADAEAFDAASKKALTDALFEKADGKALADMYGKDKLDEQALTSAIEQQFKDNPELFTTADGKPIAAADVTNLMRGVVNDIRSGMKIPDALNKAAKDMGVGSGGNAVSDSYKAGAMHIASGMLTGGLLIMRGIGAAQGQNVNPAQFVAGSLQTAAVFGEGVMKAMETGISNASYADDAAKKAALDAFKTKWADPVSNLSKVMGGVGGVIGGALSFAKAADAFRKGDSVIGGIAVTEGALGTLAAGASIVEGVAASLGSKAVAAAAAVAGGTLGWMTAGFGVFASIVMMRLDESRSLEGYRNYEWPRMQRYGISQA
jgi:trimeric autotransporter adhesin